MQKQQQNMAAIYCRLSRDDGADAESNSISTQKLLLNRYAREQGFQVYAEYVDDGISGTTFDRESFKRMVADIEAGFVGIVLCKDLSRLGRNNAMVAFYTEIFFVENNVRFIAVNDSIDSAKGENEIMGFKSIINEYYARDISKKIRSTKAIYAQMGKLLGGRPPLRLYARSERQVPLGDKPGNRANGAPNVPNGGGRHRGSCDRKDTDTRGHPISA